MKVYLLTHERELNKSSNTGRLVSKCLKDQAEVIIWKRKEPNSNLVKLIESGELVMLFPSQGEEVDSNSKIESIDSFESFILLDSTWQEARKIYNRSAYLKQTQKISLQIDKPSSYRKRRNQIEGGLSTAECVIELLKQKKDLRLAALLQEEFDRFNLM